jgi:Ca-activated chloride channel family protein
VGIGLGYDETLLAALARGGQGGHAFAEDGDAAGAAVAGEIDGLLSRTVQAASVTIRPAAPVQSITLFNDLPGHVVDGAVVAELGDLWAAECRTILLSLTVPALPALGLARVATLELRYVALPALVEQTVELPLYVNVVPGDEAAGRVPDPKVREEVLFQRTQEAKRAAAAALAGGDHHAARALYAGARAALAAAPPTAELAGEAAVLAQLDERLAAGDVEWTAKTSRAEHAHKARRRGRG